MFAVLRAARKSLGKLALCLSFVALAACDPGAMQMGGGPAISRGGPVPVALLVPYESTQGGDVALATSLENAARMAIADLDGAQIDLRVYPTGGQAERASSAASQAVADGAKVILGPVYGGSAKLAGLAAGRAGVNVLSFSNNPDVAGGNVFILGPTFDNTANRLVSYARANGKSRIMVVNGQAAAEQAGAEAIRGAIARQGATLAGQQSFELSQQGVVSAIQPIASTARSSGADAIFFTSGNDGAMPLLAQMLPENGIRSPNPQYIGLQRWNIPPSALSLPGLQDSWFAIPDQQLAASFSSRYTARYGSQPHALAGLAYDGIAAIGALASEGNTGTLSAQALTRRNGFVGVNGVFRLMSDGTNERALSVATIQNNQVIEIDPAPRAFGGFGF
ncbi:penicillin-binding protein activator [Celeribacter indicus]|uniref:Branched-chain amino acid ABC transporter periplasmic component-like protein n=1 Tax=Celeribacter indicus TaxID=1208324 RepID=A0A0B5DYN1_9RHOB|nr:penicillin-binding protein activator [Celeribacter indicus]AJE48548.1 branched-chain amino acid ABC transporter periplasmic component-like protein [Celeribacter indicus]SDX08201.1 amino acid/amide ABC transporter substrate-binding protein, HAAT family [Celeribacter indicus]